MRSQIKSHLLQHYNMDCTESKMKAKWLTKAVFFLSQRGTNFYFWHELFTFSMSRKMCSANSRMAPRPPLLLQMYATVFWAAEQASAGTALRPALFRHSSSDTSLPRGKHGAEHSGRRRHWQLHRANSRNNSGYLWPKSLHPQNLKDWME